MRISEKLIILFFSVLPISVFATEVDKFESEGNLVVTNEVVCVQHSELKNSYTPADLYPAVAACIIKGDYTKGGYLYFLANAYGYFDAKRVSDSTARQAISALQANNLWGLEEQKRGEFVSYLQEFSADDKAMRVACDFLNQLGRPDYYPRYMIQHGMDAFLGREGGGLKKEIDLDLLWDDTLEGYMKCGSEPGS